MAMNSCHLHAAQVYAMNESLNPRVTMSFSENVLQRTKTIETMLMLLGGYGGGLYERAAEIFPPLDERMLSRLRLIASVRNKVMEDDSYVYPHDEEKFLESCEHVATDLENILNRRDQGLPDYAPVGKPIMQVRFARVLALMTASFILVLGALFFFIPKTAPAAASNDLPPIAEGPSSETDAPKVAEAAEPEPKAAAAQSAPSTQPAPAAPVAQAASIQQPPVVSVAEAKVEAVRRYPELAVSGSDFNLAFLERYQVYQMQQPDYFRRPSWPLELADEISKELHTR